MSIEAINKATTDWVIRPAVSAVCYLSKWIATSVIGKMPPPPDQTIQKLARSIVQLRLPTYDELGSLFMSQFKAIKSHPYYETFKLAMSFNDNQARLFFWDNLKLGPTYGYRIGAMHAMAGGLDFGQVDYQKVVYVHLLHHMERALTMLCTENGRFHLKVFPSPEMLKILPEIIDKIRYDISPWQEVKGSSFSAYSTMEVYQKNLPKKIALGPTKIGHINITCTNHPGETLAFSYSENKQTIFDNLKFYQFNNQAKFCEGLKEIITTRFKESTHPEVVCYADW